MDVAWRGVVVVAVLAELQVVEEEELPFQVVPFLGYHREVAVEAVDFHVHASGLGPGLGLGVVVGAWEALGAGFGPCAGLGVVGRFSAAAPCVAHCSYLGLETVGSGPYCSASCLCSDLVDR